MKRLYQEMSEMDYRIDQELERQDRADQLAEYEAAWNEWKDAYNELARLEKETTQAQVHLNAAYRHYMNVRRRIGKSDELPY